MLIALVFVLANIATAARLICYQRHGARYRPVVSAIAYLLIAGAGAQAIDVLINSAPVTLWQAGFAIAVAALVLRARGNVACIARIVS